MQDSNLHDAWNTQQEFDEAEQCSEQHLPVFQQSWKLVNKRTGHGLEHSKLEDQRYNESRGKETWEVLEKIQLIEKNSGQS